MTTQHTFICENCKKNIEAAQLFDALMEICENPVRKCNQCGGIVKLHLKMAFALGVDGKEMIVNHVFIPSVRHKWDDGPSKVEFYPMLVCCERSGYGSAYWMPYWHLVERDGKIRKKYGQWAPFMNSDHLNSLIAQANKMGYKIGS